MTIEEAGAAQKLASAGMAALARGDGVSARQAFEGAIRMGWPGAPVWLALAAACRLTGDVQARRAALERAIEIAPSHPRALLLSGAFHEEQGSKMTARGFYAAGLRALGQRPPPPEIAEDVSRAQAFLAANPDPAEQRIRAALADIELGPSAEDRLFAQSIDLLLGNVLPCYQRPTRYYYPGLPQRQFYETHEFTWTEQIEASAEQIGAELAGLLADRQTFAPYVENTGREAGIKAHKLRGNPDWGAYYLVKQGQPVQEHVDRCPATFAALAALGELARPAPAHSILFSRLAPGAAIPPHHGQYNTRLICHLPLIVPPQCGFRVGNEVREWQPGRLLIFDDTIEHEAWNLSDRERIILIFEIWRPELSDRQRSLISRLIATLGGRPAGEE